jgi:hypothetical protein
MNYESLQTGNILKWEKNSEIYYVLKKVYTTGQRKHFETPELYKWMKKTRLIYWSITVLQLFEEKSVVWTFFYKF